MTHLTPAQSTLVTSNMKLAQHLAQAAWRKNRAGMEIDEVVSVAYEGLIKAAQNFNPDQATPETVASGAAFAGYARIKINGAILDWQRKKDHVPKEQRRQYKSMQKSGLGNGRSVEEVSDLTGIPYERVRQIIHAVEQSPISIEDLAPAQREDDMDVQLEGESSTETSALENKIMSSVVRTVSDMEPTQQLVVIMRFYAGLEIPQIAQELGLRLVFVKELHNDAVIRIHQAMLHEAS